MKRRRDNGNNSEVEEKQIVNTINLAGFGLGIGSGRTSGYGRYHVVDVQ